MSAAYVVTKDVRHLAAWTQNRETAYRQGSYRPICGGKVRDWKSTVYPRWDDDGPELTKALRKPVCRKCLETLAELVELEKA
jgi:hypothetical protein